MKVAPRKSLGQHFLVDENILGVIERLAALEPADVVLEIGPGLGVLTRFLAERVAHVHAAEVDRRLEPHLAGIPRTDVHWGDALRLDVAALEPPPRKLVANLPYNIATPVVAESLALPQLDLWCVMVQREVADRFFARPRTKAYGSVSVLVQLATERTGLHPVSREVFRPKPNVESALVAFTRTGPAAAPQVKRVVEAAFGHRRKTLANSLSLAAVASREQCGRRPGGDRPRARTSAPRSSSLPSSSRSPERSRDRRRPGEDQPGARRRAGPWRRQARARDGLPASRPRRPDQRRAGARDDRRRVRGGHDRAPGTRRARRAARLARSGSRSGSRSPPGSRAAAPTRPRPSGSRMRSSSSRSSRPRSPSWPLASAPTCRSSSRTGRSSAPATGRQLEPVALPQDFVVLLLLPKGERKHSTAAVYEAFDRRGGRGRLRGACRTAARVALGATRRPRDLAQLPPNDLASSPHAEELRALGAFRADVSGAGPVVYALFHRRADAEAAERAFRRRGRLWITVPAWYG